MRIITLTTDFGTTDGFVAAMKGVILSLISDVTIVDITHAVAPQDIAHGAFLLADAARFFPGGSVHVGVVDPGVGSRRRAIAVEAGGQRYVGPDNGLFTHALGTSWRAVELSNASFHRPDVSSTFHGRDIFAPVAAHLARGVALEQLGPVVTDLVTLPPAQVIVEENRVVGAVLHVDAFGNALCNVREHVFRRWLGSRDSRSVRVKCGTLIAHGIHRTFSDVTESEPVAYLGSSGVLELAVRNGNAARVGGISRGSVVEISAAS